MEFLENRTFEEINVGDSASLTRTLTEKDIQIFAIMSGDINPAHVDIEYARSDMFKKIIGHGMWGGALISTVLGTELPGPGTIYVSQTLRFKAPVGIGDSLTVTVTAVEKKPEKKRIVFNCECKNQNGQVVIEGQAEVVAPDKKIRRAKTVMPEISLRRTSSLFDDYITRAKTFGSLRAAVILPIHRKIIESVHDAAQLGLIAPVLIGPFDEIQEAAAAAEIDISHYEIINADNNHAAISQAVALARSDAVGMLIRGAATREDLLHAISRPEKGIVTNNALSYALVLDVPTYSKALIITDTLININPTLDIKRDITQNAIDFAHALGIEIPKVALLSGSDNVTRGIQSTVDAAALCKMAERGQIQGGIVDGPLTFDNVISIEVAAAKGITSPVIGNVDILVMPNMESGAIVAKQLEYLAESRNAGLVLGGRVPVLMSHINDVHLGSVSCALAILNTEYQRRLHAQSI